MTKDHKEIIRSLPAEAKQYVLALSVLTDRIGTLPKPDRDELFALLQEWKNAADAEERESVQYAMEEILAQVPIGTRAVSVKESRPLARDRKKWAEHVGKTIKGLREVAGLTQVQLADKAGIPQSHVSRLENAEYSATHMTLQKIATALGVEVGQLDPTL